MLCCRKNLASNLTCSSLWFSSLTLTKSLKIFFLFWERQRERERDRVGQGQRERQTGAERIPSKLRADSMAPSHQLWDHDGAEMESPMLNRPSHPGSPQSLWSFAWIYTEPIFFLWAIHLCSHSFIYAFSLYLNAHTKSTTDQFCWVLGMNETEPVF